MLMFFALRKSKTQYLRYVLPLVANILVFTVFLCQCRAQTRYLRSFHHVARSAVSIPYAKKIKAPYFTRFLLPARIQKSSKHGPKPVQNDLQKHHNFSIVFPASDPRKRENTSRVKDFWGGSAAGARSRQAKASCLLHTFYGEHRRIKGLRLTAGR